MKFSLSPPILAKEIPERGKTPSKSVVFSPPAGRFVTFFAQAKKVEQILLSQRNNICLPLRCIQHDQQSVVTQ